MLGLIWSRDDNEQKQSVRDEVVVAYYQLHFHHHSCQTVASNLVQSFVTATSNQLPTLQELIIQIFKQSNNSNEGSSQENQIQISSQVVKQVWNIFRDSYDQED